MRVTQAVNNTAKLSTMLVKRIFFMSASAMEWILEMFLNPYKLAIYQYFRNREDMKKFFCATRSPLNLLLLCSGLVLLAGCVEKAKPVFPQATGTLSVEIRGLRSDKGEALVSLFSSKDGFPDDMGKAWQNLHVKIKEGRALADFTALPYGTYALGVLHDEDINGQMDSSWLGQPREGFGFSGRPEYNFGPPSFDDTAFLMVSKSRQIVVWMRYETERENKQNKRRTDQNGKTKGN
jgi:uncharacterized protein (DUF2141 family)